MPLTKNSPLTTQNSIIRLLFLCNAPDVLAGTEKTALMLHEGLDRDRFRVRFILDGYGPFYDALRERDADVEVIPSGRRYSLRWHNKLVRSLQERPVDIIQLHSSRLNAMFLRPYTNAKFVERLNMTRHSSFFYPMRWKWLDRNMARFVDHFIVVSESLKEQFMERGYREDKLTVVYNGIDIPESVPMTDLRGELGVSSDTLFVGTAGRLTAQKGMDTFVRAAAQIAQRRADVQFVLAGDGELRGQLEGMVRKHGIEHKVHFLGFRNEVSGILSDLDVVLYLSRWEPFANTILEAMSVGAPIVATDVGGNAEAITDGVTGRLVPVDDAERTAETALELLDNENMRERLGSRARKEVQCWSVANMIRGHEEVYAKLGSTDYAD